MLIRFPRLLAVATLLSAGAAVTDSARADCPQGTAYLDGCAGAPPGTAPYPAAFTDPVAPHDAAYPVRPPWNVPGIDYYVGVPLDLALADLGVGGALPACASFDSSTGMVRVTSTPCDLVGIDFASYGACIYILSDAGAGAVTIAYSRFAVGTACPGSYLIASGRGFAGNLTILYNSFFGNGPTPQAMSGAIGSLGNGDVDIEYNYITHFDQHGIDYGGAPSSVTQRFNFFEDFGMQVGSHPDSTYFCGGTFQNVTMEYNLSAEWYGDGAQPSAELMTLHADRYCGSSFINPVVQYNVILAPGTGRGTAETASYVLAAVQDAGQVLEYPYLAFNYIDWSGAYGPIYPQFDGIDGAVCVGNIDLSQGISITGLFGIVNCY